MALSLANRRRTQTSSSSTKSSWMKQSSVAVSTPTTSSMRQNLSLRKQYSFIETPTGSQRYTAAQRAYLSRGLSVERSIESIRQKLYNTTNGNGPEQLKIATGARLSRQSSVDIGRAAPKTLAIKQLSGGLNIKANGNALSKNAALSNAISAKLKDRNLVAWSSTSSLLKTLDNEIAEVNNNAEHRKNASGVAQVEDLNKKNKYDANESRKTESNRINLNIVLSQTIRATNELETGHSDIESLTDCGIIEVQPHVNKSAIIQQNRNNTYNNETTTTTAAAAVATPTTTSSLSLSSSSSSPISATKAINNLVANSLTNANNTNNTATTQLNISPALTVQRRPPLVRAMSAPVRGLDENSKSVIAANKRQQKLRRRKILTRNVSCDKSAEQDIINADGNSGPGNNNNNNNNKKVLARSRTVVAPDVITLVSLLSSEGSDSEKEDNSSATNSNGTEQYSPTRRAPLLRKTGKSVSFQDSYPPTFQLASKEYSHMLRRGSIAPLAARIRSNRPPTAPPVSIFLSDPKSQTGNHENKSATDNKGMADGGGGTADANGIGSAVTDKSGVTNNEKENNAAKCNVQEYNYPDYVRSIKERECWKLFQKMCAKGVNVTYDTVLRGMLTPTEFRQLQKQRDIEEAKAKEAAEAAAEAVETKPKTPTTAIERLSESLLNNKK